MIEESNKTEIVLGTYEDFVVGCELLRSYKKFKTNNGAKPTRGSYSLDQSFAVRFHSGSVRCIAANADGSMVISGGNDELLNLFGLKKRRLIHTMDVAVNCAVFVERKYLVCGCEDGDILIYECKSGSMDLAKTLKGHESAVTCLDVHPSGKVLLSFSRDNTLRTWNLIKGRSAYTHSIKADVHLIKWSKNGDEFALAASNEIYLYNKSGELVHVLKLSRRVNSVEFLNDSRFVVAIDSGILEHYESKSKQLLLKHEAHDNRIKAVKLLVLPNDDDKPDDGDVVHYVTASSDGVVKAWRLDVAKSDPPQEPIELARTNLDARLTCMTCASSTSSS